MLTIAGFKAYDLRGRIPTELNEEVAYRVGRAYIEFLNAKRVVVGRDIRLSSNQLAGALIRGITDAGADVVDIGLCGTEGVYFATSHLGVDGGVMVTASHNPPDYNGMKFVREQSRPISGDTGLQDIRKLAEAGNWRTPARQGKVAEQDVMPAYIEHLLSYVELDKLKPLHIVCNAGNGGAGLVVDRLEPHLPFKWTKIFHEPDGTFPNGVPNPMLEENHAPVIAALKRTSADFGIAWDGDFDRCFFFDEQGTFIEGYYLVGVLAQVFLRREAGAAIVHDPRLTWNTLDIVKSNGGRSVLCKSGHAFIKDKMRENDAIYGGEMSAHHYFRNFAYCDSGMIPWLVMAQVLSELGKPLSTLVAERIKLFPVSGEINRRIPDAAGAIKAVQARYEKQALSIDFTDGLSMEFDSWRINLRSSNTEPLIRLNIESRGDAALMHAKTAEVLAQLAALGAVEANH